MTEPRHSRTASTRALGGATTIILFIICLAAFVIQSSLTQYVQGALGFRQPFFLLYVAHSSFFIIFPMHILYLAMTSRRTVEASIADLKTALARRLSPESTQPETMPFPTKRLVGLVFAMTTGLNIPSLLWYAAVSLTSIGDVTALWNTNTFWVYVLTVKFYHLKWEPRKLGAVVLACLGVILDVYGGSKSSDGTKIVASRKDQPTAPVIGDGLTFVASISYALYQVLYKRYVALPNDLEVDEGALSFSYESLSEDSVSTHSLGPRRHNAPDVGQPKAPPFGLHPNFLTTCMGLCTFVSFSFGFPVLHWLSIERFTLPPDAFTIGCMAAIATAGVVFNSCYMILLGSWGPVLTSVGNLLTIVLVLISDFLFTGGLITIWSLLGSGMIVAAFGVLVIDMTHNSK